MKSKTFIPPTPYPTNEISLRAQILDAARAQVRRHGEAKTNVVDIARALGTSHTTIYRHFRSKADIFDALVIEAMRRSVLPRVVSIDVRDA